VILSWLWKALDYSNEQALLNLLGFYSPQLTANTQVGLHILPWTAGIRAMQDAYVEVSGRTTQEIKSSNCRSVSVAGVGIAGSTSVYPGLQLIPCQLAAG